MSEKARKELIEYRKRPDYTGYEDYTPSGRAALAAYNKAEARADDMTPVNPDEPSGRRYSPSAAKKAQEAQREAAAEIKRETRGAAQEGEYAKGGKIGSASRRADGIAKRGKTRGKFV